MYTKEFTKMRHCGCPKLLARVKELSQLKLHVGGHIHESAGKEEHFGVQFVNASIMDGDYKSVNSPIIVKI
jgi:Icc-related predicted phosphoesterase